MKNTLYEINRVDITEETIWELEHISIKIILNETREKHKNKNAESIVIYRTTWSSLVYK